MSNRTEQTAKQNGKVRLRFAPSPTGYLHVGGARTALFNYLFAKARGGTFVLRIEDTDRARSTDAATKQLLASLVWLGCNWDEGPEVEVLDVANFNVSLSNSGSSRGSNGPYYQSQRLDIYNEAIEFLLKKNMAYPCVCSPEKLDKDRAYAETIGKPYVYDGTCRNRTAAEREEILNSNRACTIRFVVEEKEVVVDDLVKGLVRFDTSLIGDFVIRKSDGFPTYNFAVVVDDAFMEITHVLRGDDHLSNTPRQIMIFKALQKPIPQFAHIAMILGENKQKLSKRDGAVSVLDFAAEGYYSGPMANHLALLGWSPSDGVEVLSRKELEMAFTSMKFGTAAAVFHRDKLDYFNGLYIRNLPEQQYLQDLYIYFTRGMGNALNSKTLVHKKSSGGKEVLDRLLNYYGVTARQNENWIFAHEEKEAMGNENKYSKAALLLLALRNYCKKLADIQQLVPLFFAPPLPSEEARGWTAGDDAKKLLQLAYKIFSGNSYASDMPAKNAMPLLESLPHYISAEEFAILKKEAKGQLGVAGKPFFMAMRVAITSSVEGLELDVIFKLLKRSDVLRRISSYIA